MNLDIRREDIPHWNDVPWKSYSAHVGDVIERGSDALPGCVIAHDGPLLEVATREGTMNAEISGRLRYLADLGTSELPAIGDFVLVRRGDPAQIDEVLPRKTVFKRKEAGIRAAAQVICANADVAVIVTTAPAVSSDRTESGRPGHSGHELDDFSLRRIERYVATLDPSIRPIVVLNKCDLVPDRQAAAAFVAAALPGTTVIALSALTGTGVDALEEIVGNGTMAVLVGSSGCGKSTLIARLVGTALKIGAVRETDGRGRHTTTSRRMYRLPAGGILVDTPGMREIQLWADDGAGVDSVDAAFPEISKLEGTCRFRDCRHEHEPGCAVKAALADGSVLPERYQSYLALREESEVTAKMRRERAREWGKQVAKFSRQWKKAHRP